MFLRDVFICWPNCYQLEGRVEWPYHLTVSDGGGGGGGGGPQAACMVSMGNASEW